MTDSTDDTDLVTQRRIMAMMRKVLTNVARDTAPTAGSRHPLREETIRDIRHCLKLISSHEQELAKRAEKDHRLKPRFVDQESSAQLVNLDVPKNTDK